MSTDIARLQSAFYETDGHTLSIYVSIHGKIVLELKDNEGVMSQFRLDEKTTEDLIEALVIAATTAGIPLVNVGFK